MKTILLFILLTTPILSFAQRNELYWERAIQSTELYKTDPKSREDSINHVIKDTGGMWCATIIVKIVDDKLESLTFNGTILGNKMKIGPKEYCIYIMDDGSTPQLLRIDSPSYVTKDIYAGNDSVPRFKGGQQYTISIWAKTSISQGKWFLGIETGLPFPKPRPLLSMNGGYQWNNGWNIGGGIGFSPEMKDEVYIYRGDNVSSQKYKRYHLAAHVGYDFLHKETDKFCIMPQVGLAWDCIKGGDGSLNGYNEFAITGGVRIGGKIRLSNSLMLVPYVTPEFGWVIDNPKSNYDNISSNIPSLKHTWDNWNFNLRLGVQLYIGKNRKEKQ